MKPAKPKDLELLRKAFDAIGDTMNSEHSAYYPTDAAFTAMAAVRLGKTKNAREERRRLWIAASALEARRQDLQADDIHPTSETGYVLACWFAAFAASALFWVEDHPTEEDGPPWTSFP